MAKTTISDRPLVSVVIITWNRRKDVLCAVRSVFEQPYRPVEVIVVDNGSTDGTVEALERAFPQVRILALSENWGACKSRNKGIRAAKGEIIFTLDSDARLSEDTLAICVDRLQRDPELGIVTCQIQNFGEGIDPYGSWIFSYNDLPDRDAEFESYNISECGSAMRKAALAKSGLYWERLFFGREAEDLALRMWAAGYKVLYCGRAIVKHYPSPRKRVHGGKRDYWFFRNILFIALVRYPWWMLLIFLPLRVGTALVRALRRRYIRQAMAALGETLRELPSLWKERQPIDNATAWRYIALQREHGPLRWDLVTWLRHKA